MATQFTVGEWVYCTVIAVQGWYQVTAVRPRDHYIKISGYKPWCPWYNFTRTPTDGSLPPN